MNKNVFKWINKQILCAKLEVSSGSSSIDLGGKENEDTIH
jgi:hypothetical protein